MIVFYGIVIIFFAVIIFKICQKSPTIRGWQGERTVRRVLGATRPGVQYVLNNYKLVDGEMSCQIDHILINENGVFVIETKNYSGRIYGSDEQQKWTQVLAHGKVKNKFYNPVKQNDTHVYRLRKVLPQGIPLFPVVVFVQNNTQFLQSRTAVPLARLLQVIHICRVPKLTTEQMEGALLALENARADTLKKKEHLQNIRRMQETIAEGRCPRCGGKLILRNGKYGYFYGCENYPSCTFKKK